MPHSVSPEASPSAEDTILPDAPTEPHLVQDEDLNDSSEDDTTEPNNTAAVDAVKPSQNEDVKLEDLFNDDDEDDEEFPSSSGTDGKMASSPPQVQPMYVSAL